MKKRVKFLFTIASLCFAVAVLCFGVYSATTVTYTASGTVSYEVNSVFCKINTTVEYANGVRKSLANKDAVTAATSGATWTATADTIAEYDTGTNNPNADAPAAVTLNAFNFATSSLYKITVVVTIYKQANTIALTHDLVGKAAPDANALVNTTLVKPDAVANIDASAMTGASETRELVFYVALADVTTAASGGFTLTVNVAQAGA